MKVYVIRRNDGAYLSQTGAMIPDLFQANLFFSYEQAKKYCKYLDSKVVECSLMETTELSDYTKQVRKQVAEEIRYSLLDFSHSYWKVFKQNGKQYMTDDDLSECLDEILDKIGEKEC